MKSTFMTFLNMSMLPSTENENGSVMHIHSMNRTSRIVAGARSTRLRSRVTTIPSNVEHARTAASGRSAAAHASLCTFMMLSSVHPITPIHGWMIA